MYRCETSFLDFFVSSLFYRPETVCGWGIGVDGRSPRPADADRANEAIVVSGRKQQVPAPKHRVPKRVNRA